MVKEKIYEVVPVDPLEKLKKKSSELESEIHGIKKVLKETVTISKLSASADELVEKIIEMVDITQQMLSSVSRINEKLTKELTKTLKEMDKNHKILIGKMDNLITAFSEALEVEETVEPEVGNLKALQEGLDRIADKLDALIVSNREISAKLSATHVPEKGEEKKIVPPPQKPPKPPLPSE
jgi:uncharacterized phage infection (PIP) family protein YhgE